ncbi:hypothetical protein J6590_047575 [Homalodisca vitripennis]|nr:hypothetical protein J6590_047575 [Homalodisca vitripennis]
MKLMQIFKSVEGSFSRYRADTETELFSSDEEYYCSESSCSECSTSFSSRVTSEDLRVHRPPRHIPRRGPPSQGRRLPLPQLPLNSPGIQWPRNAFAISTNTLLSPVNSSVSGSGDGHLGVQGFITALVLFQFATVQIDVVLYVK